MKPRFLSLFTGGDGAGEGARQANYDIAGGVEFRPDLAAIAQANHPEARIVVGDVRAVDYTPWRGVDHLHASPSCKKASIANADRGETPEDIETAQAVCRAIRETLPTSVSVENVRGYAAFEAYAAIIGTLRSLGYGIAAGVLNAANYGVPQTRERLIVVAVRGLPDWAVSLPPATHAPRKAAAGQLALFDDAPPLPAWVGWYKALEDLLPTLPSSQFAPWQLARLPDEVRESVLISNLKHVINDAATVRLTTEPAPTVSTGYRPNWIDRAFILDGQEKRAARARLNTDGIPQDVMDEIDRRHDALWSDYKYGRATFREFDNAARAWLVDGTEQRHTGIVSGENPRWPVKAAEYKGHPRAWLSTGRVVQLTPRALARLQSFPDAYVWPEKASLACEAIGNAVPPLLMRRIMEHVAALAAMTCREAA